MTAAAPADSPSGSSAPPADTSPREELPQRLLGGRAFHHVTLNPIVGEERSVSFVFPDPGHGTNRALRYWASDHLLLWEALRLEGVEVEVIVAVRDNRAKDLYDEPCSAGLRAELP